MSEKECCTHDCQQSDTCPIRAFWLFQHEQAKTERRQAMAAIASESSVLLKKIEKQYVLSSVRLALLAYAVFALVVFVYYRVAPL